MEYYRPRKLSDALVWLDENQAGIAAGCTDLLAASETQYLGKYGHSNMLDITAIDELHGIERENEGVRIGAATCWRDLISADLPPAFDGLKAAAREVGSVQIQNAGTIGGNLCNASPAADGVPPLLVLDAEVELVSTQGLRNLPLDQFLSDVRKTALSANEILSAIFIPASSINGYSSFKKLGARKYLVISIVMVATRVEIVGGAIADIAIGVGSCSAVACRLKTIEAKIKGAETSVDLEKIITYQDVADMLSPITDIRADGSYRLKVAREMIIRALHTHLHEPQVGA